MVTTPPVINVTQQAEGTLWSFTGSMNGRPYAYYQVAPDQATAEQQMFADMTLFLDGMGALINAKK